MQVFGRNSSRSHEVEVQLGDTSVCCNWRGGGRMGHASSGSNRHTLAESAATFHRSLPQV